MISFECRNKSPSIFSPGSFQSCDVRTSGGNQGPFLHNPQTHTRYFSKAPIYAEQSDHIVLSLLQKQLLSSSSEQVNFLCRMCVLVDGGAGDFHTTPGGAKTVLATRKKKTVGVSMH